MNKNCDKMEPVMAKICPYCNSSDVQINSLGDIICFDCFNICSDVTKALTPSELPPPFPEEIEEQKIKRKSNRNYGQSINSAQPKLI